MPTARKSLDRQYRLLGMAFIAMALFVISFAIYVYTEWRLDRANERRFTSFTLADELRQSSDDLTKMVRAYVATGKPTYRQHFLRIMLIRDGKLARPQLYNLIYWDLVLAGVLQYSRDQGGQKISLLTLMQQAGFSAKELNQLAKAKQQSDKLTELEIRVMRLSDKARHIGGARGIAMQQEAMSLLFDEQYITAKALIMQPINAFFQMANERTLLEIQSAAR